MCLCQLSLYFGFVWQVLLQVLIILSGNYNFFNLLTLTLCLSLLDDQHVHFWLRKRSIGSDSGMNENTNLAFACATSHFYPFSLQARPLGRGSVTCWSWWSGLSWLQELFCASTCSWIWLKWPSRPGRVRSSATIKIKTCIKLTLASSWWSQFVSMVSCPAFTYHQFNQFMKTVTIPSVWIGVLSLTWELISSMFRLDSSLCWGSAGGKGVTHILCSRRCACVSGFLKRFCGTVQWTVFAAATAAMFTISLVGHSHAVINRSFHGYQFVLFSTRCPSPM